MVSNLIILNTYIYICNVKSPCSESRRHTRIAVECTRRRKFNLQFKVANYPIYFSSPNPLSHFNESYIIWMLSLFSPVVLHMHFLPGYYIIHIWHSACIRYVFIIFLIPTILLQCYSTISTFTTEHIHNTLWAFIID